VLPAPAPRPGLPAPAFQPVLPAPAPQQPRPPAPAPEHGGQSWWGWGLVALALLFVGGRALLVRARSKARSISPPSRKSLRD
jgi:hypothetical protein